MKIILFAFLLIVLNNVHSLSIGDIAADGQNQCKTNWFGDAITKLKSILNIATNPKKAVETGVKPVSASAKPASKENKLTENETQKQFNLEVLKELNQKRSAHGVRPLVQNEKLKKLALEMAKKLAETKDVKSINKQENTAGQLIFYKSSDQPNFKIQAKEPVEDWYKEIKYHDFSKEPIVGETLKSGHFCQVIWKKTTDVGIAHARSADKKMIIVVVKFLPQGNIPGQFKEQVLPLAENLADNDVKTDAAVFPGDKDFNKATLKFHNYFRKTHHAGPLKLSDDLNKSAQLWADKIARDDDMQHGTGLKVGENLYSGWFSDGGKPKARDAVTDWYNEIKDYKFNSPKFSQATGHFTQVIWNESTQLGVGWAQNQKSKKYYVVCHYKEQGNVEGKFKENVKTK